MTSTEEPGQPVRATTGRVGPRPRGRVTVPRALGALMAAVAIIGITWAVLVPPFQAPDETLHFAYAQSLATRFALPGTAGRPEASTDQSLADAAVRASTLAFFPGAMRPEWSPQRFRNYVAQASRRPSQSNGGGPNPEAANPPLFYLYSDLAYWASGSGNLFARLYAMRAWGVVLLLANVVGAWLLAGEVFGRRRAGQLVCAGVCGLMPMETFISTSVTPDALLVPLWTIALWLGARLIRRGWRTGEAVGLCALTAAAILTKATSYALLPGVLVALVIGWRRAPAEERRALLRHAGAALATVAAPVLGWVAFTKAQGRPPINTVPGPAVSAPKSGFRVGGFLSSVWEFYLPRLSFIQRVNPPHLTAYYVWLKQGWATFGWQNVQLPPWTYRLFAAVTAAVGVADVAILVRAARRTRWLGLLGFFALVLLALLFGLHLTAYRSIIANQGGLLQGRYLLPVIGLWGLAVALVVLKLPRRWRGMTAGAVLAGLLLLQVLSLATIARTYYT